MYLEICFDYIDMLCSPSLDLRGRLVLASKVSFFFSFIETMVSPWLSLEWWKF